MLVIDASTWFDLFNTWDEERRKLAERFFEKAEHHPIYEQFVPTASFCLKL